MAIHSPEVRKATISLSSTVKIQLIMQCNCLDFCKFFHRTKLINQKKPFVIVRISILSTETIGHWSREVLCSCTCVGGCLETWLPFVSVPSSRGRLWRDPAGNQQHHLQPPLPLRVREQCWLHLDHPGWAGGHHRLSLHRLSTRGRIRFLRDQWNRSTIYMVSAGEERCFPHIQQ